MLAEALVGDLTATVSGGDSQRAATVLAQLIGSRPCTAASPMCPSCGICWPARRLWPSCAPSWRPRAGAPARGCERSTPTGGRHAQVSSPLCCRPCGAAGPAHLRRILHRPWFSSGSAPALQCPGVGPAGARTDRPAGARTRRCLPDPGVAAPGAVHRVRDRPPGPVAVRWPGPGRRRAEGHPAGAARVPAAAVGACGGAADPARPGRGGRAPARALWAPWAAGPCAGISPWDAQRFADVWGHGVWLCSRGPVLARFP